MEINYKRTKTTEEDCVFEIKDIENVFLKAKNNYYNAITSPHFAQFLDGKEVITVFIEKYNEVNVRIYRTDKHFVNDVRIKNFLKNLQPHYTATAITREEFFEYYNRLTILEINKI